MSDGGEQCDVLVTGAAGVLGRRIVDVLRQSGQTVVATGRTSAPGLDGTWDVARQPEPDENIRPVTVVHAAAQKTAFGAVHTPGSDLFDVNVGGTARVVAWSLAQDVRRLVLLSGALIYGGWQARPRRETDEVDLVASGAYGVSKFCAEKVAGLMASAGRELCVLRLSSLWGPGYDGGLPQRLISDGTATGEIRLKPPVDVAFDLLHVEDAALTVERAVNHPMSGIWNVGGGAPSTLKQLSDACADAVGAAVIIEEGEPVTSPGVMNWVDDSKARKELGHSSTVDLTTGVSMIVGNEVPGTDPR